MVHNFSIENHIIQLSLSAGRYVKSLPWFYSSPKSLDVLYLLLSDHFIKSSEISTKRSYVIIEQQFLTLVPH